MPPPKPILIAIVIFTATLAISSIARAASCTPSFPYAAGSGSRWLGADGAYSIPLDNRRVLWLFGDTFVSTRRTPTKSRAASTMLANSIAISTCPAGKWSIEYRWNAPARGRRPRPFFDSRVKSFRYWPLDGFLDGASLYIALLRVRSTRARGPFAFRLLGVDLAKIANPGADPRLWSITYQPLSRSRTIFPGGSIVVRPPYAYLLGVMDHDRHKRHALILTRIALDHLDRPAKSLEYLAACHPDRSSFPLLSKERVRVRFHDRNKLALNEATQTPTSDSSARAMPPVPSRCVQWRPAPIHADADELTPDAQTEFSVRYHPDISRWVLVQQQPGLFTDQLGFSTAPHLDGPWSAYRSLATEPEMHRRTRRKRIFCYGAKEHPEFESTPRTLVATYACNSFSFRKLIRDMSIYHPVVIQLPMH